MPTHLLTPEHPSPVEHDVRGPTLNHAVEKWLHVIEAAGEASPRHLIESRRIYERVWRPLLGSV